MVAATSANSVVAAAAPAAPPTTPTSPTTLATPPVTAPATVPTAPPTTTTTRAPAPAAAPTTTTSAAPSPSVHAVPYQFVTKLYTELLGRAPTPAEWKRAVSQLTRQGCRTAALRSLAGKVLSSTEYARDYPPSPQNAPAIVLTVYRAVLNRDPSPTEFVLARDLLDTGTLSVTQLAERLFATFEFAFVTEPAICSATDPSYGFGQPGHPGQYVATQTPVSGAPGPDANEFLLQLALDKLGASGGGTFPLSPREVVSLTNTLIVPSGVTLTTQGSPGPHRYADMAHLARSPLYAPPVHDAGPVLVLLDPGARLEYVWVDGQRQATDPNSFLEFDVRMLGGADTTVDHDRLGDPFGASVIEDDGSYSGIPGAAQCRANSVSDNLIEGYGTSHVVPAGEPDDHPEADAIGVYCQDTTVVDNDIVDVSDTAVAVFDGATGLILTPVQHSLIAHNVVVSAGNSYSFGIAIDPSYSIDGAVVTPGDPPGKVTRTFDNGTLRTEVLDNTLWSGPRTHYDVILSNGTHDLFGSTVHEDCYLPNPSTGRPTCGGGRNAVGGVFLHNNDGGVGVWVQMGIYVGGVSDAVMLGNRFAHLREVTGGTCPKAAVVDARGSAKLSFTPGLKIDTPYTVDRALTSDACVTPTF